MCAFFLFLSILYAHIHKNQNFSKSWHVKFTLEAPIIRTFNHEKSISLRYWDNVDWILLVIEVWRLFILLYDLFWVWTGMMSNNSCKVPQTIWTKDIQLRNDILIYHNLRENLRNPVWIQVVKGLRNENEVIICVLCT